MNPPVGYRLRPPAMQGFTLLEMLLSLLLMALLLSAIYAGLDSSLHLVHHGVATAQRDDQIEASSRFLRRALSQIRAVPLPDQQGQSSLWLKGSARELRYAGPVGESQAARGLQFQQLQLVADGHHGWQLQLRVAPVLASSGAVKAAAPAEVLLDGIKAGQFSYKGADSPGQPAQWQTLWQQPRQLPRLIALDLQLTGTAVWPHLEVPLRIDPDPAQSNGLGAGLAR